MGPLRYVDGVDLEAPQGVHCVVDEPLTRLILEVRDQLLFVHEPSHSLLERLHDKGSKILEFITFYLGHPAVSEIVQGSSSFLERASIRIALKMTNFFSADPT